MNKILVIHSSNEMFGSDQVLLHTLTALRRAGWQPLVLLPNDLAYTGELSRELHRQKIPVRIMSLGILRRGYLRPLRFTAYGLRLLLAVLEVRRIIRAERVRVVYSATGAVVCGALAAAWMRKPHVWHIHEILRRPRWMVKLLGHFYALFATRMIAVSQAVHRHWSGIDRRLAGKMAVIYNGVDVAHYSDPRYASRRRRKKQAVVVGCLGRIGTWKGQEVLLQALHRLGSEVPVRALIAGGTLPGAEEKLSQLKELSRALGVEGRVTLKPFQKDVRPLLATMDIAAVPSVKPEPFGMVILEAMAFGLPVIATNIGGSPEVVVEGGTGLLVPPHEAQALAEAIRTLAYSAPLRERLGRAGRKRVQTSFSLEKYQKNVVEFFAQFGAPVASEPARSRLARHPGAASHKPGIGR